MARILVCGGRDFGNCVSAQVDPSRENLDRIEEYKFIHRTLDKIYLDRGWVHDQEYLMPNVFVISGKARGVDTAAIDWACVNWCQFREYPADWNKHGKAAGPIRNRQMLDEGKPDLVVAFPGGKGTADMVKVAKARGFEVMEIKYG